MSTATYLVLPSSRRRWRSNVWSPSVSGQPDSKQQQFVTGVDTMSHPNGFVASIGDGKQTTASASDTADVSAKLENALA